MNSLISIQKLVLTGNRPFLNITIDQRIYHDVGAYSQIFLLN
jgi:hypothetical protein